MVYVVLRLRFEYILTLHSFQLLMLYIGRCGKFPNELWLP